MKYEELELFYKYCYNRINYEEFEEIMMEIYFNKNYIEPLWKDFQNNMIGFIISRNEKVLFYRIIRKIKIENYKG